MKRVVIIGVLLIVLNGCAADLHRSTKAESVYCLGVYVRAKNSEEKSSKGEVDHEEIDVDVSPVGVSAHVHSADSRVRGSSEGPQGSVNTVVGPD